ncbi:hypothetical protein FKM82_026577 [Ascaphus truei]
MAIFASGVLGDSHVSVRTMALGLCIRHHALSSSSLGSRLRMFIWATDSPFWNLKVEFSGAWDRAEMGGPGLVSISPAKESNSMSRNLVSCLQVVDLWCLPLE